MVFNFILQSFYPVNFLRNVALQQVNTPYVFLTDIDFLPMYGLYPYLKKSIQVLNLDSSKKVPLMLDFRLLSWCGQGFCSSEILCDMGW
jgi:glycosyltransferase-like protein LARGE